MARDRKELEKLADQLASLSEEERQLVLSDVERRTGHRAHLPWRNMRALKGIVSLGGDAVQDCDDLYR